MVRIEPLQPDSYAMVADWLSQPSVNAWMAPPWRGRRVIASMVALAARNPRHDFSLVRVGEQPCGIVALADIDAADRYAMVWYALGRVELAGQGVMTAALLLACSRAFGPLGLLGLHAWIVETNEASRRVLLKAGFREAGRLRAATVHQGRRADKVYFDLLASNDSHTWPPASVPERRAA